MAQRIDTATDFVRYLIRDSTWLVRVLRQERRRFNTWRYLPGTITSQVGSPTSIYAMTCSIRDDEALIIELKPLPDGVYWSLQAGDVWVSLAHTSPTVTPRSICACEGRPGRGFSRVVAHKDRASPIGSITTATIRALCVSQLPCDGRTGARYAKSEVFTEVLSVLPKAGNDDGDRARGGLGEAPRGAS